MEAGGYGYISHDLGAEQFWRVELFFFADVVKEGDFDAVWLGIGQRVEQEGFDGQFVAAEGGPVAYVGDGAQPVGSRHVDAGLREEFVFGREVEGGDGLFFADAVTFHHRAFEGEGFAQHAAGAGYFAGFDQLADGGAADAFASPQDGSGGFHFEAELFAEPAERCDVARLFVAETEIFSYDDDARAELVRQHVANEVFGGETCDIERKRHQEDGFDAFGLHASQALRDGVDQFGRALRSEHFGRMGIEGEDGGDEIALAGDGGDAAQDFAVAGMDAVEITDGNDGRRKCAVDVHAAPAMSISRPS